MAGIARDKSAVSSIIIALFPPSSSIDFPKRNDTHSLTWRPIDVDPVNEIKGTLLSFINFSPTDDPGPINNEKIPSYPFLLMTSLHIF